MRRFRVRVLVQQKEEEEATTNDRNKKRRASRRRGRRPKVVFVGQSLFCAQRHRCVVSHTSDDVRDIKVNGNF